MLKPVRINPAAPFVMKIGFSEAAMFTKIAGTIQTVQLIRERSGIFAGQILDPLTLQPRGSWYLAGELGIYQDETGPYWIEETSDQDQPGSIEVEQYRDEKLITYNGEILGHL